MSIDLQALLPQPLPVAIAWAEEQAAYAAQMGQSLSTVGLSLARDVGVQRPELVRVKIVDRLPLPADPVLQQAALQTGLLGPTMVGLTLGHGIFLCLWSRYAAAALP